MLGKPVGEPEGSRRCRGRGRERVLALVLGLVLGSGLAACTGPVSPPPPETEGAQGGEYVIGTADTLQVRVWKSPELSVEVPVRPDGMISVPLLDDIHAAGLTTTELKELITRELSEYIENPDVTVLVTSTASKRAYVVGEVRAPGAVSLATDMRVLDAIAAVGGFSPFADKKGIRVLRHTAQGENEYRFNYDAYVKGKAPGTNFLLLPGDTIVVPD